MAIIGIDLGTSNTLACVFQNGRPQLISNREGSFMTPSAVSQPKDGPIAVGEAARQRLREHPEETAVSYKVHMGTQREIPLGGSRFRPEELSALVLRQIREDAERFLGEPVDKAVISVPAYFNDDQRCATKLAAQLAGLEVVRLINEPSAAAVYYRWQDPQAEDGKWMIVDFGGGTLDVSIVDCFENIIEIQAIAGDDHLGGDDVDRAIAAYFCQKNDIELQALPASRQAVLLDLAKNAKQALCAPGAQLAVLCMESDRGPLRLELDPQLLAQLCAPIFQRVEKVLRGLLQDPRAARGIRRIVLVGGSSRLPAFQSFLRKLTSVEPVLVDDPDHTVALGAGLCAGIKERREELQDLVMTDVCPFSLGVATWNDAMDKDPHMAVLIPRSSMLPASHTGRFSSLHSGQRSMNFQIYQGEDYLTARNLKLGELEVMIPPAPAGTQWAEVTFTYDIDGILQVDVVSSGGHHQQKTLLNPRLHLLPEQLEAAKTRIQQIKLAAAPSEDPLLERALELYRKSPLSARSPLEDALSRYGMARDSGEPIALRQAARHLYTTTQEIQATLDEDPFSHLTPWDQDDQGTEDNT